MADFETLFDRKVTPDEKTRQLKKQLSFAPFVLAALSLVAVWGVLEFLLPYPAREIPASTLVKNSLQHWNDPKS